MDESVIVDKALLKNCFMDIIAHACVKHSINNNRKSVNNTKTVPQERVANILIEHGLFLTP